MGGQAAAMFDPVNVTSAPLGSARNEKLIPDTDRRAARRAVRRS